MCGDNRVLILNIAWALPYHGGILVKFQPLWLHSKPVRIGFWENGNIQIKMRLGLQHRHTCRPQIPDKYLGSASINCLWRLHMSECIYFCFRDLFSEVQWLPLTFFSFHPYCIVVGLRWYCGRHGSSQYHLLTGDASEVMREALVAIFPLSCFNVAPVAVLLCAELHACVSTEVCVWKLLAAVVARSGRILKGTAIF